MKSPLPTEIVRVPQEKLVVRGSRKIYEMSIISVLPSGRTLVPDSWPLLFPQYLLRTRCCMGLRRGTPIVFIGHGILRNSSPSEGRAELRVVFSFRAILPWGLIFLRWIPLSFLS